MTLTRDEKIEVLAATRVKIADLKREQQGATKAIKVWKEEQALGVDHSGDLAAMRHGLRNIVMRIQVLTIQISRLEGELTA